MVNSVKIYEAQLTQRSLANQAQGFCRFYEGKFKTSRQ